MMMNATRADELGINNVFDRSKNGKKHDEEHSLRHGIQQSSFVDWPCQLVAAGAARLLQK